MGEDDALKIIDKIRKSNHISDLSCVVATTSGVGGKSQMITRERINTGQIKILKGESIIKYEVIGYLFFEFKKTNITGRTTDRIKLGYAPKLLIRKTGVSIIAAHDESGIFPEQSLYFTYGLSHEDLFYLLGLLNSRLMNFIYFHSAITNNASIAQVKKVDLDALPIERTGVTPEKDKIITLIADKARAITNEMKNIKNQNLEQGRALHRRQLLAAEKTIDHMVYDLYGLSDAERDCVNKWSDTVSRSSHGNAS